jgi:hypothetical protein
VRFGRVDAFEALQRLGRPAPRLLPTIHGYAYLGETLTAYSGVWSRAPLEPAYRWGRCRTAKCVRVSTVGTGRTYTIQRADLGHRLRVTVTARSGTRTITAVSAATRAVGR